MPKAYSICSAVRPISLPAAAAAPNTPIAAVRCQPRSEVLAKAMRHDTSSPNATASRRSRPLTPPSRSATARTAASTETPGWIEPPESSVSSKSSAWPMLAFSSAACGAGRLVPRSSTRLSSRPPQWPITAHNWSIPGEPLPPSMHPKVSRISRRADSNGARGQVRIAGAADMLGERPGGVIGHWLSPTSWHRLPGGDDCGQQADQAGRLSLPISG